MANLVRTGRTDLFNALDDFFNYDWTSKRNLIGDTFKVDVEDEGAAFLITAELPGISKEAVFLDFEEGRLTISVKHEQTENEEKKNYIHKERRVCNMSRSVYLADSDPEGIKAQMDNGVLSVTVPKRDKQQSMRKISIE